ncbi:MAG: hypothetical protein HQK54_13280, partial [Oligoflexales bacterium]|nr:hypothetical protein [Oligoflexales bacterium]
MVRVTISFFLLMVFCLAINPIERIYAAESQGEQEESVNSQFEEDAGKQCLFKPVIDLPAEPSMVPLMETIFEKDPIVTESIDNPESALGFIRDVENVIKYQEENQKPVNSKSFEQVYIKSVQLLYFYLDPRKFSDNGSYGNRQKNIETHARMVIQNGEKYLKVNKKNGVNVIYQIVVAKILLNPKSVVKYSENLMKIRNRLPARLRTSVDVLTA